MEVEGEEGEAEIVDWLECEHVVDLLECEHVVDVLLSIGMMLCREIPLFALFRR